MGCISSQNNLSKLQLVRRVPFLLFDWSIYLLKYSCWLLFFYCSCTTIKLRFCSFVVAGFVNLWCSLHSQGQILLWFLLVMIIITDYYRPLPPHTHTHMHTHTHTHICTHTHMHTHKHACTHTHMHMHTHTHTHTHTHGGERELGIPF